MVGVTVMLVLLLMCFIFIRNKDIFNIMLVALALRVIAALVHLYLFKLPVGMHDAVAFEQIAWDIVVYSNGNILDLYDSYNKHVRYNFSWGYAFFLSIIYYIFGREPIILQSVSILFGVAVVYMTWKISMYIWGNAQSAKRASFIVAIFPPMVMYSAVTMREIVIIFFIQLAVIGAIKYLNFGRLKYLMQSAWAVVPQFFLHNPVIAGFVVSYMLLLFPRLKKYTADLLRGKIVGVGAVIVVLASIIILWPFVDALMNSNLNIGYIGNVSEFSLDNIVAYARNTNYGNAVYPDFVVPNDVYGLVYLFPLRLIYFIYSPFPWDVSAVKHIVGLLDSLVYIYFTYLLYANWRYIRGNRAAVFLLLLFFILSSIYSYGVGNFANAMRHRLKFMILLLVVVSPFIKGLRIRKK